MGTPVVSTLSGGIPEAVMERETGLLYPEKDVVGITMGIISLLTDNVLWGKMSANAMKHVKEKFNIENQSRKLEVIYSNCIRRKNES